MVTQTNGKVDPSILRYSLFPWFPFRGPFIREVDQIARKVC